MKINKTFISIILSFHFIFILNRPPLVLCHLCCGHEEIHFIGQHHHHHLKCQTFKNNHLSYDDHNLNEIYFSHVCFQHELLLISVNNFFTFKEKIEETSLIGIKIEPYECLQLADWVRSNRRLFLFPLEKLKYDELIIPNPPPLRC